MCETEPSLIFDVLKKKKKNKSIFQKFFLDSILHGEWAPETLFLVYLGILGGFKLSTNCNVCFM